MNTATIFEANYYEILSFLPFSNRVMVASASRDFRTHFRQTLVREEQITEEELTKFLESFDDDDVAIALVLLDFSWFCLGLKISFTNRIWC